MNTPIHEVMKPRYEQPHLLGLMMEEAAGQTCCKADKKTCKNTAKKNNGKLTRTSALS